MIIEFKLPLINAHMTEARVERIYAEPGARMKIGEKLLDLSVRLGEAFAQDCPPISYFRVVVRESVVFRRLPTAPGQAIQVGELIALFSSLEDESLDQTPQRGLRFVTAGIVYHGQG